MSTDMGEKTRIWIKLAIKTKFIPEKKRESEMGREPLIIIISSRRFQWINVPADLDFPQC